MARDLNKKQKNLIDAFLNQVNEEEKWLKQVSFRDGVRTQHFSKPNVVWGEIPNDIRDAIVKIHDFETLHVMAQCYIAEKQSTDLLVIDRGGLSEH